MVDFNHEISPCLDQITAYLDFPRDRGVDRDVLTLKIVFKIDIKHISRCLNCPLFYYSISMGASIDIH